MPTDMRRYPADWKQIRASILERDGHRCKECGVPNHTAGYRDPNGAFWSNEAIDELGGVPTDFDDEQRPWRPVRIVLTIAHLYDPDPMNCEPGNLAALCQRCHNRRDAPMRARHAAETRRRKREQATGQQSMELPE
jgi:hypothetical protein